MRKFLIALLSAASCFSIAFAVGCGCNDDENTDNPTDKEYTVEFQAAEGIAYAGELFDGEVESAQVTLKENTTVAFSVVYPEEFDVTVIAGNVQLAENQTNFSFTLNSDTVVKVETKPHYMAGYGTSESPYKITRAYDLVYIANQVNAGVPGYVYGYYSLENDIDVKGGELKVIGNGKPVVGGTATFVGFFEGNGHTISNYKITSDDAAQVGLFGYVSVTGYADDSGIIRNLNLDNFLIEATIPAGSSTGFVGSFIGVGVATTLVNCNATNGDIVVNNVGNNTVFAGGAAGSVQTITMNNGATAYYLYSAVDYVTTNVDINAGSGTLYSAGGVVGYLYSDGARATASVVNCYSKGAVFGAQRSGGLVGVLSSYTSVANSYSTSFVSGYADSFSQEDAYGAYAGGLVGYALNDAVISDSFFYGEVDADVVGSAQKFVDEICAGYEDAYYTTNKAVAWNCYSSDKVGLTKEFFDNLGWSGLDWVMKPGELPVINTEAVESIKYKLSFDFGKEKVTLDGKPVSSNDYEIIIGESYYLPLCRYFDAGRIYETYIADSGKVSYGIYFDSDYTVKVPDGYIPATNRTLYVAFADYNEVAGSYYIVTGNGQVATLILNNTGEYAFNCGVYFPVTVDGAKYPSMYYTYDGEKIIFRDGLFARLSSVMDVNAPQNNYEPYDFCATLQGDKLTIIGGNVYMQTLGAFRDFFPEESPLIATKTAITPVHDSFYGVWEKSATINKKFTFNDDGTWNYSYKQTQIGGSYTIDTDGTAVLSRNGSEYARARLDGGLGVMTVSYEDHHEIFVYENSRYGVWYDPETQTTIYLDGYGSDYAGAAICYLNGTGYDLYYVVDGNFDKNGKTYITLLSAYSLFGYLSLDSDNTLVGCLFNVNTVTLVDGYKFYVMDDYRGEWVGESDGEFVLLDFNGYGIYSVEAGANNSEVKGYITINGSRVEYFCSQADGLDGTFTYNNTEYGFAIDDITGTVTVTGAGNTVEYQRKDEWSDYTLIDGNGNIYEFNGGGKLAIGGTLTVTSSEGDVVASLGYKVNGKGIVENLNSSGTNNKTSVTLYENGTEAGSITINSYKFRFNYEGDTAALKALNGGRLNIDNPFTGTWALHGLVNNFDVGNIDLRFETTGMFADMASIAQYSYNHEEKTITFIYYPSNTDESGGLSSFVCTLTSIDDTHVMWSAETGDTRYCTPLDELYGVWTNTKTRAELGFDGTSSSRYTFAAVNRGDGSTVYAYTVRFGKFYIWDYNSDGSDPENYYTIVATDELDNDDNVYNQGQRFRKLQLIDINTPIITATAASGVKYEIYLDEGLIKVDGVEATYLIDDVTATSTTIRIDFGNRNYRFVKIDYSDANNVTATVIDG